MQKKVLHKQKRNQILNFQGNWQSILTHTRFEVFTNFMLILYTTNVVVNH